MMENFPDFKGSFTFGFKGWRSESIINADSWKPQELERKVPVGKTIKLSQPSDFPQSLSKILLSVYYRYKSDLLWEIKILKRGHGITMGERQ